VGKEAFLAVGYGTHGYQEVVVGVALKALSNNVHHAIDTPLDAAFQAHKRAA